jgi:hypothetical protein
MKSRSLQEKILAITPRLVHLLKWILVARKALKEAKFCTLLKRILGNIKSSNQSMMSKKSMLWVSRFILFNNRDRNIQMKIFKA